MSQPAFKDTVSTWLGDVPASWTVRRLKTVIAQPITDGPHETPEFLSEGIPFLSVDGIQDGDLVFEGCRYISTAAHNEYKRKCAPQYNDILLGKAASTGKIARAKVDFEFSIWSPLALIRPDQSEVQPNFLEYSLKSAATQAQIDCLCTANTQKNISMQDIPLLVLCVPHVQEQRRIAAYLDDQTAKIDQLMDMRRRQMALLKEQRAAMIQQAVTRGLDPNVPMKDSGLPWLGEIPAHWEVKRLKHLCSLLRDGTHQPPKRVEIGYPLLSVRNIQEGIFARREDDSMISLDEFKALNRSFVIKTGDVLMAVVGATLGKVAVVPDMEPFQIQRSLAILRPRLEAVDKDFLRLLIECQAFQKCLWSNVGFSAQPGIYLSTVGNLDCPMPSVGEQAQILAFIQCETQQIDSLQAAYARQLEVLTEYRAALIHECVTGVRTLRQAQGERELEVDYA